MNRNELNRIWLETEEREAEPTARHWALYRLIREATRENPITQGEILSLLPQFYQAHESRRNNDKCRAIYSDIDFINSCQRFDYIIARTNDYRYYAVKTVDEADEYMRGYIKTMFRAIRRKNALETKIRRNLTGQGKLLTESANPRQYAEGEGIGFHPSLPKDEIERRERLKAEAEQMSLF